MRRKATRAPKKGCKHCQGRGFVLFTPVGTSDRDVVPCSCVYREPNVVKEREQEGRRAMAVVFEKKARAANKRLAKEEARAHCRASNTALSQCNDGDRLP